jgi:hypothetical protein
MLIPFDFINGFLILEFILGSSPFHSCHCVFAQLLCVCATELFRNSFALSCFSNNFVIHFSSVLYVLLLIVNIDAALGQLVSLPLLLRSNCLIVCPFTVVLTSQCCSITYRHPTTEHYYLMQLMT